MTVKNLDLLGMIFVLFPTGMSRKNQKESIVLSGFLYFCVVTAKIIGEDIALF